MSAQLGTFMFFHITNVIILAIYVVALLYAWRRLFSEKNRKPLLIHYGLLAFLAGLLVPAFFFKSWVWVGIIAVSAALYFWIRNKNKLPEYKPEHTAAVLAVGVVIGAIIRLGMVEIVPGTGFFSAMIALAAVLFALNARALDTVDIPGVTPKKK